MELMRLGTGGWETGVVLCVAERWAGNKTRWCPRFFGFCRQKSGVRSRKSWPAGDLHLVAPAGSHVFAHIIRAVVAAAQRNSFVLREKQILLLRRSTLILSIVIARAHRLQPILGGAWSYVQYLRCVVSKRAAGFNDFSWPPQS
jgi:hypothetical protein